jgi:hypothetical protein
MSDVDREELARELRELRALVVELGLLTRQVHTAADRALIALTSEGAV